MKLLLISILLTCPGWSQDGSKGDEIAVRETIRKMNESVSNKDLQGLHSVILDDAVKLNLFPAHKYGEVADDNFKITTAPLKGTWTTVATLLFRGTHVYKRDIVHMDIHINGAMAVAWVELQTETIRQKGDPPKRNHFREICVLKRMGKEWKIAMATNNRHDM
ncbi:MAG: hypothetical protein CSA81_11250 [Acidobacteria bacterium]|nr:MAG: hypothetical protein CSA81_11250 [Acidobacteriota bacterium]PIE89951.1 MAG: hypothetical protein CR997_08210 [Acidobacteriota bacterium]